MNNWNQLLAILDKTVGFPNKQSSRVKKLNQGYDKKTGEHVFWIEYRIRVNEGDTSKSVKQSKNRVVERKKLLDVILGFGNGA